MKVDIDELILVFDSLTPLTNEELKTYWFESTREDGLIVTLVVSVYDSHACVIINNKSGVDIASISMKNCSEVRVLDKTRKCMEIVHEDGTKRCFLSLLGDLILEYKE